MIPSPSSPQWSEIAPEHVQLMAERLAREVNSKPCPIPGYEMSVAEARVALGTLLNAPREWFEAEQVAHRHAAHGGLNGGDDCAVCGHLDSAVYHAQTGRYLSEDFHGVKIR